MSRALFALLLGCPSVLAAQCQLCPAKPNPVGGTPKVTERPLSVEIEAALDFSRIAMLGTQGGSVIIDVSGGNRHVSGGLRDLGGGLLKGQVRVTGEPNHPIRVILPQRVTLTSSEGGSIDATNLRTDLPSNPSLSSEGILNFAFGGQLNVTHAAAGDYRGRIPITVEYQ